MVRSLTKFGLNVGVIPLNSPINYREEASPDLLPYVYDGYEHAWELLIAPPETAPVHVSTTLWTMHESTKWRDAWRQNLAKAKAVIVPTEFNRKQLWKQFMLSAAVCPLGIDTSVFYYRPPRHDRLKFLVAGRHTGPGSRKSPQLAVDTFRLAFPDNKYDVSLTVKLFTGDQPVNTFNDHRITQIVADYDPGQLAELYADHTFYLNMSSGEGWGLMLHQMGAVGREIITAGKDGTSGISALGGYMIPATFKDVATDDPYYEGKMLHYDKESVASVLRDIIAARWESRKGVYLTQSAASAAGYMQMSWDASALRLLSILQSCYGYFLRH